MTHDPHAHALDSLFTRTHDGRELLFPIRGPMLALDTLHRAKLSVLLDDLWNEIDRLQTALTAAGVSVYRPRLLLPIPPVDDDSVDLPDDKS